MIEYATDTYQVFNFSASEVFQQFAMSGRFITAIIGYIVKTANLAENAIYWGSTILAVICIIISIYKLYKIISEDVRSKVFRILIPILIVLNPFSIELFLFIEKGIMTLGILMSIFAIDKLIKYFKTDKKSYIFYSLIFMFLANCSYQGVVGIFVVIAVIYILKYSKSIKGFIINNILTALIYGLPAIIDYILVRIIYSSGRVSGDFIFVNSLEKILQGTWNMVKTTYSLLPNWAFVLVIAFVSLILICQIIKKAVLSHILLHYQTQSFQKDIQERQGPYTYIDILKYIYILLAVIGVTILPQFMQPTESIWFVARSTYPFASLYGVLVLYLFMNYNINNTWWWGIVIVTAILFGMQTQTFTKIIKDRYELNQLDYEVSMNIIERINEYENQTGITVTKIAIYQDSNPRYTYDGIFTTGDINIKAFSTDWSTKAILEYYLGRTLETQEVDSDLSKKFAMMDWDDFDDEQIEFENDLLILCRY